MCAKPEFNDFSSFALRGLKFPFAGSPARRFYQHRVPTKGPTRFHFSSSTHRHCKFDRTLQVHALRQVRIRSCRPIDDFTVCSGLCPHRGWPCETSRG